METANQNQREPEMGLTFEKVWALFQESDRRMAERTAETDRRLAEIAAETDRRLAEIAAETERRRAESAAETERLMREMLHQKRETDRQLGKLGIRLGEIVEQLVAPDIVAKFNKLGYVFGRSCPNVAYSNPDGSFLAEVDILLENGDTALAVEVKSKPNSDDVLAHIERMEKLRRYADEHQDRRKLLGAVAGAVVSPEVKNLALKKGFFVIEQSGDTTVIDVPEGFTPRYW
jgi:Holliday junction resolvase